MDLAESQAPTQELPTEHDRIPEIVLGNANNEETREGTESILPAVSEQVESEIKPKDVEDIQSPEVEPSELSPSKVLLEQEQNSKKVEDELRDKISEYETQIQQLKTALHQKDSVITLYEREKAILEKEKSAIQKERDYATKEKESIVIKFATKEKSLIDAKKETDQVQKQLNDAKKEIKNLTMKYQALNEEKSRVAYIVEDKCNEIKKHQREIEKLRADVNNLETKLKWNTVKLSQETEAKLAAEKKLEEERGNPKQLQEERASEQQVKMEYQATLILLKHELEKIEKINQNFKKEQKEANEKLFNLKEALTRETMEKTQLSSELEALKIEHDQIQNSLSQEMLNSASLRGQLEDLKVLQTQNALNEEKIANLQATIESLEQQEEDYEADLEILRDRESSLLVLNKEMSEKIADLQNQICLQTSKAQALQADNDILKKEKLDFDTRYNEVDEKLKKETQQKNEERVLLTKHLSEKTKMYESMKVKFENAQGDLEAAKKKHSQIVKELQRELNKFKKLDELKSQSQTSLEAKNETPAPPERNESRASFSGQSSHSQQSDSESEVQSNCSTVQEPSKQHLVERILRLQQAAVRQTEKIDFLENHTMSLVAELQKKSKLVQYYMLRDQAGALTSTKSDQNKTELAKYGGVMSAIYSGIKGSTNQSMTLELSLEINKKLQAVLEDTLLKNITLKENLDVLGLEVDKLTRKLAQMSR